MRAIVLASLAFAASALNGCATDTTASAPGPYPLSGSWRDIGGGLPAGFEPSGAVWQPRTERLLVVGDEGTIASMDAEGGSTRTWTLPGDLEGICVAEPSTDRVFVAVERPPGIVEYDLEQERALRAIPFPGLEAGQSKKKNKGPEALTFVPDARDPEGGVFWAGIQGDGTVRVLSIPLTSRSGDGAAREIRRFAPRPGHADLSALAWDAVTGTIWAVYDKEDLAVVLDTEGRVKATYTLPGEGQEGIALTSELIFVADDAARRVMRSDRVRDRRASPR